MKTILLSLIIALCFSKTPPVSGSLEGAVIEKDSREPVLFAFVTLLQNEVVIAHTETDMDGHFLFTDVKPGSYDVLVKYIGLNDGYLKEVLIVEGQVTKIVIEMEASSDILEEVVIIEYKVPLISKDNTTQGTILTSEAISKLPHKSINAIQSNASGVSTADGISIRGSRSNENATAVAHPTFENPFYNAKEQNTTTMSIDVDRASYSYIRSQINDYMLPHPDDVRMEEMINYFSYQWQHTPESKHPFGFHYALNPCPWAPDHQVLTVALKAKSSDMEHTPKSNLVFLIDVSGSMNDPLKLPLLKKSLYMLVDQLRENDRVSIVVYAGAAGTILDGVSGDQKHLIKKAIEALSSGGSTAGGEGIISAYRLGLKHFIPEGNNRVILATDGDFNVGISSDQALVKLIEEKRQSGIFLSVLGFGTGNYQDAKMQKLADAGNGNHFYIDNETEARKCLVKEFGGSIYTIAKDVKVQLHFNKDLVKEYRVIGYENRQLANEDFDNDHKDAGEMGADHTVTIQYEIIPQKNFELKQRDELAEVEFRYKLPHAEISTKGDLSIRLNDAMANASNTDVQWALSVAEFGLLLKNSRYKGIATYEQLIARTEKLPNVFADDEKIECLELMKTANNLWANN